MKRLSPRLIGVCASLIPLCLFGQITVSPPNSGGLSASSNLSDVSNPSTSRTNLGERKIFNVKTDYGALGDGTTNDTVVIQSAITAAFSAGGGTVYFPKGVYLVSGALDGTTNSVLKIPDNGSSAAPITIRFEGEFVPRTSENPASTSGVVIKSTTTGSGTAPAILAGKAYSDTSGGLTGFNYVSVEISNIMFRTPDNPTLGAIQMHNVIDLFLDNVQCDTGTAYGSISQPTHSAAVAILCPGINNHAQVSLRNVSLFGYYEGVHASEHTHFDHVAIAKCIIGMVADQGNRPFYGNVSVEWCPTMIFINGASVVDLDVRAEVHNGAAWYSSVGTEINDASNQARGRISYVRVDASVGPVATELGHTGCGYLTLHNKWIERTSFGGAGNLWSGVGQIIESNLSSIAFGTVGDMNISSNAYYNGTNWKYQTTGPAANLFPYNGAITLRVAGSGSADGTITWTNALVATLTGTSVLGTTTNDSATAGNVGEYVSSLVAVGSPQSLSNGTAANVTSISLTAGDWDVQGNVNFTETTSTVTARSAGISSTSATLPTDGSEAYCGVQSTVTSETNSITLPRKRISIASTTTVYLVGKATFSAGTCGGFGSLTARRVR